MNHVVVEHFLCRIMKLRESRGLIDNIVVGC